MGAAERLQQRWYSSLPPPWWTWPLALLHGRAASLRRALYRHGVLRTQRLPCPVVVVGNLVAGGAGKTPLVIGLVEALGKLGWKVGVVSRGYGGSARAPRLLDGAADPAVVGDEPALIRLRTGVPVAVGARRPDAAKLLLAHGVDVVIADDGLQHYALARDLEICVIDGSLRFGNGRLLPAGPLREPPARLRKVDFVVCNGGKARAGEASMRLVLRDAVEMGDTRRLPLESFAGQRVHAVAGIGNPARFFDALRTFGIIVIEHPFPDHHRHLASALVFDDDAPVLMTEKDAVKCRDFARPGWWSVPVDAALPATFLDAVAARLAALRQGPMPAA